MEYETYCKTKNLRIRLQSFAMQVTATTATTSFCTLSLLKKGKPKNCSDLHYIYYQLPLLSSVFSFSTKHTFPLFHQASHVSFSPFTFPFAVPSLHSKRCMLHVIEPFRPSCSCNSLRFPPIIIAFPSMEIRESRHVLSAVGS